MSQTPHPPGPMARPFLRGVLPFAGALLLLACGIGCGSDDPADLGDLKRQALAQEDAVNRLKAAHVAVEGRRGYLIAEDSVSLEQRTTVQRQNVTRERVFALIAARTHRRPDEVAALFSDLARQRESPSVPGTR